jgi:hypothetical protein
LIVACSSANLTRAGWWENVEVCHVETLGPGEATRLKEPLGGLLGLAKRLAANPAAGELLEPYRTFVRGLERRAFKSQDGWLWPHLYVNGGGEGEDLADFLGTMITPDSGYCLEVISPFFDRTPSPKTLLDLIMRLKPDETRVFIPRDPTGAARCTEEFFDAVSAVDGVSWGSLPDDLLHLGRSADAGWRSVHAKVYRVFKAHPKREYLFVGSPNLTSPGHSGQGGNVEVGFLVQIDPARRPDFWLKAERRKPEQFEAAAAEVGDEPDSDLPVQVRFSWKTGEAYGRWDGASPVTSIELRGLGGTLASNLCWPAKEWTRIEPDACAAIREELKSVSILTVVVADRPEGRVLVQEEDMALKPELLRRLPIRDILHYWALLRPEQRQVFLESRVHLLSPKEAFAIPRATGDLASAPNDMFERCAGIFHAFSAFEAKLDAAISENHSQQAAALLFGERFDSLPTVLSRVLREHVEVGSADDDRLDDVDRYLVLMCAEQICRAARSKHEEFWAGYLTQARALEERVGERQSIRQRLADTAPPAMPGFLDWFDKWFLKRAEPVEQP